MYPNPVNIAFPARRPNLKPLVWRTSRTYLQASPLENNVKRHRIASEMFRLLPALVAILSVLPVRAHCQKVFAHVIVSQTNIDRHSQPLLTTYTGRQHRTLQ